MEVMSTANSQTSQQPFKAPVSNNQSHLTTLTPLEKGALCPLQKAALRKEKTSPVKRLPQNQELSPQRTGVLKVEEAAASLEKQFMRDFLKSEDNQTGDEEDDEEEEYDDEDEYKNSINNSIKSITSGDDLDNISVSSTLSKCKTSCFNYHFRHDWIEKLMPEEVRWFYREEGGNKTWCPFIGYDSLRIETKFQELKQNGCRQCEERVRRHLGESLKENGVEYQDKSKFLRLAKSLCEEKMNENEPCVEKVIVRGGLFEVDVLDRRMTPIYWSDPADTDWRGNKIKMERQWRERALHTSTILRGSWFKVDNGEPLKEDLADQIETEHLKQFEGRNLSEPLLTPSGHDKIRVALHTMKFPEFHLDWYTYEEVYLYSETTSHYIRQRLGLQKVGTRLRRGYMERATMADKLPDITRLCFVIHGIGQKMLTGAIIKSCSDLRENCERIKQKFFPDLTASNQRVEFLPVEWRSSLRLDGDTVNSITPSHLSSLRTLLNSSAMDILYYTSPLYRTEIIYGLQSEINRLYTMFCARHPYFEASGGKVNIVAHSLGTVITYDILLAGCHGVRQNFDDLFMKSQALHQDMSEFSNCLKEMETLRARMTELEVRMMQLAGSHDLNAQSLINIRLENFFCLGSPLAVFIALRGVRPRDTGSLHHILPPTVCRRIFNIYHPFDPVAYRIEPLILKHYATIHPVIIYRWDATSKPPYDSLTPELISTNKKKKTAEGRKEFRVQEKDYLAKRSSGKNVLSPLEDERVRFQKCLSQPNVKTGPRLSEGSSMDILSYPETPVNRQSSVDLTSEGDDIQSQTGAYRNSFGGRFQSLFYRPHSTSNSQQPSPQHLPRVSEAAQVEMSSKKVSQNIIESELEYLKDGLQSHSIVNSDEKTFDEVNSRFDSTSRSAISEKLLIESSKAVELTRTADELTPSSLVSGALDKSVTDSPNTYTATERFIKQPSGSSCFDPYQAGEEQTHLDHRIDYQLRESRYENSYFSVLTSHTSYWTNPDVAMFIMTHLFPDYGPIGIPKL